MYMLCVAFGTTMPTSFYSFGNTVYTLFEFFFCCAVVQFVVQYHKVWLVSTHTDKYIIFN